MPVLIENLQVFILGHGYSGLNSHPSDILIQARQHRDSEGMIPWIRFVDLLGEESSKLFRKELSKNTKHQKALSKTIARANRKKIVGLGSV